MVAITLGLLILVGLSMFYLNSSRAQAELEKSSRQIENGRYAMQTLMEDIRQAGYYAEFDPQSAGLPLPATLPDPCSATVGALTAALPLPIQGYNGASPSCLSDVKPGTDVVAVRRVGTCVKGTTDCPARAGDLFFQASLCNGPGELGSTTPTDYFALSPDLSALNRHKKDCTTIADRRQLLVRLYFVANNDQAGDGVPTLKRVDIGAGGASAPVSIASGIDDLQFDYGLDTGNNGTPAVQAADPSTYGACAPAACVQQWASAVAVNIHLLARNELQTAGYTDTKTYALGLNPDGTARSVGPFNDHFKRHAFQSDVQMLNPSGRRAK